MTTISMPSQPSFQTSSGEDGDLANVETGNTEGSGAEGSHLESILSLPGSQETALLRSMSESCLALLSYTGSEFAHATSPQGTRTPTSPQDKLLSKSGLLIKSPSMPTLNTEGISAQKTPLASFNLFSSQSYSDSQKQSSLKDLARVTLPTTSSETPSSSTSSKTVVCNLHLLQTNPETSSSSAQCVAVPVHVYSKTHLQESSKIKISKDSQTHDEGTKKQSKSTLVSTPMDLFKYSKHEESSLHKTDTEEKGDSEDKQKEKRDDEQQKDHQDKQENSKDNIYSSLSVHKIAYGKNTASNDNTSLPHVLPDPLMHFALSESQLSVLFDQRVSNLCVLKLCTEIMKLMLSSRGLESDSRHEARKKMLLHAEDLVESYLAQATLSKWLGIITAGLGIIGAGAPLFGEVGGEGVLNFIKRHSSMWQNAEVQTFFKSAGDIFTSLSQLSETAAKVYELKETASRTFAEQYKDLFRMDADEFTRSIEEIKDHWKSMDHFLLQILQTEHDTTRSLYQ